MVTLKDRDYQNPSINLNPLLRVGYVEINDESKIIDDSLRNLMHDSS